MLEKNYIPVMYVGISVVGQLGLICWCAVSTSEYTGPLYVMQSS